MVPSTWFLVGAIVILMGILVISVITILEKNKELKKKRLKEVEEEMWNEDKL